jgi:hypothetical protein
MALDAATLTWINRLGPEPTPTEVIQLRLLRRHATEPSQARLLDSILGPASAAEQRAAQRAAVERRIAYVESSVTPEATTRPDAARRVASQRLVTALTDPGPQHIGPAEAERRSSAAAEGLGSNEIDVAAELRDLRARLAAFPERP